MRLLTAVVLSSACTSGGGDEIVDSEPAAAGTFSADAWADNWFAMYVDGARVVEDSVSITTERSFNKESWTFEATPPFQVAAILKDFKENDSGLEYIGEQNQQMGDGGFIAQMYDSNGDLALVTSAGWKCLTIHTAPLDKSCERAANPLTECTWESLDEPDGWKDADFDDSAWDAATEWTAAAVDPKDGYDEVTWASSAALIWGDDLEQDNTILCRVTVN